MNLQKTKQIGWRLLLIVLCCNVLSSTVNAHSTFDRFQKERPLYEILDEISERFQVFFSYDSKAVSSVNLEFTHKAEESFDEAIQRLLLPIDFGYESYGKKYFVIYKKDKKGARKTKKLRKRIKQIQKLETGGNFTLQRKSKNPVNQLQHIAHTLQPSVIPITGIVTSEEGEPLIGATIQEKGTSSGTITDLDGTFQLNIGDNSILVISYIGYRTQEIQVDGRTSIDVQLAIDAAGLEEVIVIGYGTIKKSDVTGSVSSIDAEDAFSTPVANLDQAIQGRASGVQVTTVNGAPGSGATIRIRGGNSITAGNEPLYVVDGFIGAGDLTTINPNDIASIEILKDASSTAIYGTRGANGVVLITTKRGKEGETKVNLKTSVGVQSLPQKINVQNAAEYATFINSSDTDPTDGVPFDLNNLPGEDTDWQEVLTQDALITDNQLSISGGTKKTQFYVSAGLLSQEGIIKGSQFDRYSLRTNIDNKVTDNLKIGANVALTRAVTNNSAGTSNFQALIRADPLRPVFDEDGNFTIENVGLDNNGPHILANSELNTNETTNDRMLINTFAEVNLAEKFTLRSTLGLDVVNQKRNAFIPSTNPAQILANQLAEGQIDALNSFGWLNENTINYNETIGDHSIGALVGFTVQQFDSEVTQINANDIPSDGVGTNALELAPLELLSINSDFSEFSLLSFLGRVNYSYKGKYLVTASLRRDGSSRLGSNNRYATFPSIAAAWRVTEEDFIRNNNVIDHLKIRASVGQTGNQGIAPFSTLASLSTGATAILGGASVVGAQQGTLANADLKWETTTQYDLGIDIGLFKSRVIAEIDFYYKKTNDLLLNAATPALTGFTSTLRNVGSLDNKGIDIALTGVIADTKDFGWSATLNISTFKNKVLELGSVDFITTHTLQGTPTSQLIVGEEVGTFVGAIYEGVDAETGEAIFADINGDGVFDPADDLTVIGNANPDIFGGFQNTFRYKNFDVQAFFQFSSGNDIYNLDVFQVNGTQLNSYADLRAGVWSVDNPNNATIPRIGSASLNRSTSLFLQDGSFLRFRTLSLGYTIPSEQIKGISSLRIFATGNNLFLINSDDYLGFDPDVNSFGTDNTLRGYDQLAYPQNRSFIFGAEVSF